jgi:hypothetical protein
MSYPTRGFVTSFKRLLENRVVERLCEREAAVLPPLQVSAEGRTVTVRGLVASHAARRAILAIVREVPGVERVIDDIAVATPGDGEPWQRFHYRFSPALARYFEERRQGLVSQSAVAWDS